MFKNKIINSLNKFKIDFTIHQYIKTEKSEYLTLILNHNSKRIDGRYKIGKLLIEYFQALNYRAYFYNGLLYINTK